MPLTLPIKAIYLGYGLRQNTFYQAVKNAVDWGYNLIVIPFWIRQSTGDDPYSGAYYWARLGAKSQKELISYARERNARIILAVAGATYGRATDKTDYALNKGSDYGTAAANFAKQHNFDGIDFDMENFDTQFRPVSSKISKAQAIQWLIDATRAAKKILGADSIITHAPEAPYFSTRHNTGYLDFYKQIKAENIIDYFLVQYYNQGSRYKNYESQMIKSDSYFANTAIAQLIAAGIPKEMIVMGKLMQRRDGTADSWVPASDIAAWVAKAKTDSRVSNWNTGVSTWQYHTQGTPNAKTWIDTIFPKQSAVRIVLRGREDSGV